MRADRLLAEVALLRTHGRMSAAELARRVETSERTVLRDMEALSSAGVPVYSERGRAGGFALLPGYRPPAEDLTDQEARALFVAGGAGVADALGLGPAFEGALRKLAIGLPERHADELGHTLSRIVIDPAGWGGSVRHPALLTMVFDAVQADRRLVIDYRPLSSGRAGRRTVDPWGVVLAGRTWYLLAAHRGSPRTYRVSRMTGAHALDQPCRRPADLDVLALWRELRARWQSGRAGERVTLRVQESSSDPVVQALGMVLQEPPVVRPDPNHPGHDIVTATVSTLRGTVGMLLGYGDWLEVLDPPELRSLMLEVATKVTHLYTP